MVIDPWTSVYRAASTLRDAIEANDPRQEAARDLLLHHAKDLLAEAIRLHEHEEVSRGRQH